MFSQCVRGFSPGSPASSHSLKTGTRIKLVDSNWLQVGRFFLSGPAIDWRLVRGVCPPLPNDAGVGYSTPALSTP